MDREFIGKIMHESWSKTKRAQGFYGPGELAQDDDAAKYHPDLIPWELLPEPQKDINRHAFDAVIEAIRSAPQGQDYDLRPFDTLPEDHRGKVERWLKANDKQSNQVRWSLYPIGMVGRWIERAEQAEKGSVDAAPSEGKDG